MCWNYDSRECPKWECSGKALRYTTLADMKLISAYQAFHEFCKCKNVSYSVSFIRSSQIQAVCYASSVDKTLYCLCIVLRSSSTKKLCSLQKLEIYGTVSKKVHFPASIWWLDVWHECKCSLAKHICFRHQLISAESKLIFQFCKSWYAATLITSYFTRLLLEPNPVLFLQNWSSLKQN